MEAARQNAEAERQEKRLGELRQRRTVRESAAVPPKQPFPKGEKWTQPQAKIYLPPQCKIILHKAGGTRWTVTCPYFAASPDRTVSFGTASGRSCYTSLCLVLQLAWKATTKSTGSECPWDIPDFAFA